MFAHRSRVALTSVAALVAVPAIVLLGASAQATTTDAHGKHAGKHAGKHEGKRQHAKSKRAGDGVEPGTLKGGTVFKLGWWAKTNEPPPETGLVAPPSVPALIAPKGSLPVAQVGGESERITAIEFDLKGKPDGTVQTLKLALRETADPSSNPNSAAGTVTACPLTESFWVGVENGPWATRPTFDCALGSVAGKRDDQGVWTFDLSALAFDWLSSDRLYAPAVMLVSTPPVEAETPAAPDPAAAPSSSFQVAFDSEKGIGLLAKTKAPVDLGDDGSLDDGSDDGSDSGSSGGSPGGTGDLGSLGGGSIGETPIDSVPIAGGIAGREVGTTATGGTPTASDQPTALAPVSAVPLPWHAGLGPRLLLVVPALLLAYLLMLAMGPAGQPVAGQGRRGVSRALDRLRPVTPTTKDPS